MPKIVSSVPFVQNFVHLSTALAWSPIKAGKESYYISTLEKQAWEMNQEATNLILRFEENFDSIIDKQG